MTDRLEKAGSATMRPPVERDSDGRVTGKSFWLDLEPEPIYAVLHTPPNGLRTRVAALILPPFGIDDESSYRPRRDWATRMAESGIATARIDFPGTDDSVGSPFAPNRFQTWVDSTVQTAHWLRDRTGCDRLVAVGISLGGLIACQAIAAGAPIDDLVLWGVRATGRAHLRELRALAAMVAGEGVDPLEDTRAPAGAVWIGGHMMSAETAEELSGINLTEVPLPQAELRRVLLVGRDAHGVDAKLANSLVESGADVTVIEADDYYRLIAQPDWGWTPTKTISASIEWLRSALDADFKVIRHSPAVEAHKVLESVVFEYDGNSIRERLSELQTSDGRLTGIISEPAGGERAPYGLVIINAGALRHTGPSRLYVDMARRAAASGVTAVRFDLPGAGDSDGSRVKAYERRPEDDARPVAVLREIYDHLQKVGVADRFVAAGLCMGGYLAIRLVLADERSIGAVSMNPPALLWTNAQTRRSGKWFASISGAGGLVAEGHADQRPSSALRRIAHRADHARRAIEFRLGHRLMNVELLWRFEHRAGISSASKTLDQLGGTSARVLLLFSDNETVPRILALSTLAAKLQRNPNIDVEHLPTGDHDLRPLRTQEIVLERLSSVLHELGSTADGATPTAAL
jgi:dienelactone hydrolase